MDQTKGAEAYAPRATPEGRAGRTAALMLAVLGIALSGVAAVSGALAAGQTPGVQEALTPATLSLAEVVHQAQESGPEFAAVRRQQQRNDLAQRQQQVGHEPQLTFTGELGLQQSNAPAPSGSAAAGSLPVGLNDWRQAGLSLSWNLANQWQVQGRLSVRPEPEGNMTSASVGLQRRWPSPDPTGSSSGGLMPAGGGGSGPSGASPELAAAQVREANNAALAGVVAAWYRARQAVAVWRLAQQQQAVAEWEYQAAVQRRDQGGGSLRELLDAQDQLRQAEERTRTAYAGWLAAWQELVRRQGQEGSPATAALPAGSQPRTASPQPEAQSEQLAWVDDYGWDALAARIALELGVPVGTLPGVEPITLGSLPAGLSERLLVVRSAGIQAQETVQQAQRAWQVAQAQKGWSTQASLQWSLQSGLAGRPPQGGWQALLTFSHPLYEPTSGLELEAARVHQEEAVAGLAERCQQLAAQVVEGWQLLQNAAQALADAQIGHQRSLQTALAADARYQEGLVSWSDWRRAHLAVAQAQAEIAQAQAEYNQLLLELADRLGLDLAAIAAGTQGD